MQLLIWHPEESGFETIIINYSLSESRVRVAFVILCSRPPDEIGSRQGVGWSSSAARLRPRRGKKVEVNIKLEKKW